MLLNGQIVTLEHLEGLPRLERKIEWSEFPADGKSGAYCADMKNLMAFVDEKMQGQMYLEIGTFDGVTISAMAKKYPEREFCAIDKFIPGHETRGGCLAYFIENNIDNDNVLLLQGTSTEAVAKFRPGLEIDFVFIDADHSYEWVRKDIDNIFPFIRPGGIISFHDFFMDGVRKAILERFPEEAMHEFGDIVYFYKEINR